MDAGLTPVATTLIKLICSTLTRYLSELMSLLRVSSLSDIMLTFTATYIAITGYRLMMGKLAGKIPETCLTFLIVSFVTGTVFQSSFYIQSIVEPYIHALLNACAWFATLGSSNDFLTLFTDLDTGFEKITVYLTKVSPQGFDSMSIGMQAQYILLFLASNLAYGIMYMSYTMMMILPLGCIMLQFSLGFFFIFFAAFKETRGAFFTWVKSQVNYSLVMILSSITMSIMSKGILYSLELFVTQDQSLGYFTANFGVFLSWQMVCIALLYKCPDLAAGLTGQMSGSTAGIVAISTIAAKSTAFLTKKGAVGAAAATVVGYNNASSLSSSVASKFLKSPKELANK